MTEMGEMLEQFEVGQTCFDKCTGQRLRVVSVEDDGGVFVDDQFEQSALKKTEAAETLRCEPWSFDEAYALEADLLSRCSKPSLASDDVHRPDEMDIRHSCRRMWQWVLWANFRSEKT